jgi:hypothetical protein
MKQKEKKEGNNEIERAGFCESVVQVETGCIQIPMQ